eukprot:SM000087S23407  [mRNA]  locus=s87:423710:427944:- [translate_table: standard]
MLISAAEAANHPLAAIAAAEGALGRAERPAERLHEAKYVTMTAIQRAALPHALCGRDVLGAAKTGSGKTLAFLIPVLERLYRQRWGAMDGVGAIVISPTRELALQNFHELQRAGKHHGLSGGLLVGGKRGTLAGERDRVGGLNVIIATPGRLLQHMDETPNFDCSQLQARPQHPISTTECLTLSTQPWLFYLERASVVVLVLDEADRILDLGFREALDAILANLPRQRQTLLFSATQTKSVKDLARLSLRDPEYIAAATATPARLQQTVMLVPLARKLDMLWSFIRTHLHAKMLVFLSSCKQVKFLHESFRRLRPGTPLKCLHGRMKQIARMATYEEFCGTKSAVFFCTDVAARGLDFPQVDWVVQTDCPDDVASYIHRVGRTARYTASGKSLLFLCPSEKGMLPALEAAKIPFKVTKVTLKAHQACRQTERNRAIAYEQFVTANPAKMQEISAALAGLLAKDADLKYLAQRAFVTYLRSIHLQVVLATQYQMRAGTAALDLRLIGLGFLAADHQALVCQRNKDVFDVAKLPHAEFAASMGLPTAPTVRFLKKGLKKLALEKEAAALSASQDLNSDGPQIGSKTPVHDVTGKDARSGSADNEPARTRGRRKDGPDSSSSLVTAKEGGSDLSLKLSQALQRLEDGAAKVGETNVYTGGEKRKRSKKEQAREGGAAGDSSAASSRKLDRDAEGDDADFLRIKGVDHSLDGEAREQNGAASRVLDTLITRKRKKKLKIRLEDGNGNRLVFDEEGNAMQPLAALAAVGPSGGEEEDIAAATAECFRRLQAEMRRRDAEDWVLERQKLRERRVRAKLKAKGLRADEAGSGSGVVLGNGGASSGDEDEELEYDEETVVSDSNERDEAIGNRSNSAKRQVPALRWKDVALRDLSLAEQEALAMQLIAAMRRRMIHTSKTVDFGRRLLNRDKEEVAPLKCKVLTSASVTNVLKGPTQHFALSLKH